MTRAFASSSGWLAFAVTVLAAVPAVAHISLEKGGTHLSRSGDDPDKKIKFEPCGVAGSTRGTNVYTYKPGETITVKVVETIPHPSYFRIAFDADGDDDFVDPVSIDPIDNARGCPIGPTDHCGASDFNNNASVLMDNLDPHLASLATPTYTWQVTLPNVQCTNCTLQIIQVMQDDFFHGPYDTTPGIESDPGFVSDVYHQCIDLVLDGPLLPGAGGAPSGAGGDPGAGGFGGTPASTGGTATGVGGTISTAGAPSGVAGAAGPITGGGGAAGGPQAFPGAGGTGVAGFPGVPVAENADSGDDGGCGVARSGSTPSGGMLSVVGLALAALLRRRRAPRE